MQPSAAASSVMSFSVKFPRVILLDRFCRWGRPVYECDGRLYVDVDPRRSRPADICTKQGNAFDGEPCDPVPKETIIEFIPERDTWPF